MIILCLSFLLLHQLQNITNTLTCMIAPWLFHITTDSLPKSKTSSAGINPIHFPTLYPIWQHSSQWCRLDKVSLADAHEDYIGNEEVGSVKVSVTQNYLNNTTKVDVLRTLSLVRNSGMNMPATPSIAPIGHTCPTLTAHCTQPVGVMLVPINNC